MKRRRKKVKASVTVPAGEFTLSYSPADPVQQGPRSRETELRAVLRAARKRAYYWSSILRGYSPRSHRNVRMSHAIAMAEVRRMCLAIEALTGKRPRCSDPAPRELGQHPLALG